MGKVREPWGFPGGAVGENLPASAEDTGRSIPGLGPPPATEWLSTRAAAPEPLCRDCRSPRA